MLLDFIVIVRQGRKKSFFRGAAALLGFVPSLLGMTSFLRDLITPVLTFSPRSEI
jgi:hypothetical protein